MEHVNENQDQTNNEKNTNIEGLEKSKSLNEILKEAQLKENQDAIAHQKEIEDQRMKEYEQFQEQRRLINEKKREQQLQEKQIVFQKYLADFEPLQVGFSDFKIWNEI